MDHHHIHVIPSVTSTSRNNDCEQSPVYVRNPTNINTYAPRKAKKQRPAYFISQTGYSTHQAPRPRRTDVGSACRDLKPLGIHRDHKVSPLSEDDIEALLSAPSPRKVQPPPCPAPRVPTPSLSLNAQFNLLEQLSSCTNWSEIRAALPEEYRHLVPEDDPSIDFCEEFATLCDMYDDLVASERFFDDQDFKVFRPFEDVVPLKSEQSADTSYCDIVEEEENPSTGESAPTHPLHGVGGIKRLRQRARRCLFPRRTRSSSLLRNNWTYPSADTAHPSKGPRTERLLMLATSLAGILSGTVVSVRFNSGFMETQDGLGSTPGELVTQVTPAQP